MIKEIIHDPIFLAGKSETATKEDLQVAQKINNAFVIDIPSPCRAEAYRCQTERHPAAV